MLRCKEGELAVILAGPYRGFIVTVGKFVGTADIVGVTYQVHRGAVPDLWEIHTDTIPNPNGGRFAIEDKHLQPIRGGKVPTTTEKEMRA